MYQTLQSLQQFVNMHRLHSFIIFSSYSYFQFYVILWYCHSALFYCFLINFNFKSCTWLSFYFSWKYSVVMVLIIWCTYWYGKREMLFILSKFCHKYPFIWTQVSAYMHLNYYNVARWMQILVLVCVCLSTNRSCYSNWAFLCAFAAFMKNYHALWNELLYKYCYKVCEYILKINTVWFSMVME